MKIKLVVLGALTACLGASGFAQSPGSIESELKYAREYLDARNWEYAKRGYEDVLRKEPDNQEARVGYERAKAAYEAQAAARAAQAKIFDAPKRPRLTPDTGVKNQSKPKKGSKLSARDECERLAGSCWVTTKSPSCWVQKRMCYNRNGLK